MVKLRLKELRENEKLTQKDLAKNFNVTQQSYARWEANINEPKLDDLIAIADFYGVSLDYLCNRENPNSRFSPQKQEIIKLMDKLDNDDTKILLGFVLSLTYNKDK